MTTKEANDLAMKWVDEAPVSETSREYMVSSVSWFLWELDKRGYEIVPRFRPGLSVGDIERMKEEGVIY